MSKLLISVQQEAISTKELKHEKVSQTVLQQKNCDGRRSETD